MRCTLCNSSANDLPCQLNPRCSPSRSSFTKKNIQTNGSSSVQCSRHHPLCSVPLINVKWSICIISLLIFFNYFVLNITLPFLSSTISRLMGLTHCHQVLEPSSSSVPCFARLSDTAAATSTLQTIVIQCEAGSLIMPLRPTKCDAQLLTPFMLLAL